MDSTDEKPMYGIWMPGRGWLRAKDKDDVFADYSIEKAQQVASKVGKGATVLFIDKSIAIIN